MPLTRATDALPADAPKGRRSLIKPCVAAALFAITFPAAAIDPGEARVLSAQGQRLKVEIPYASAPGQAVSAVTFSVVAAHAPSGSVTLSGADFAVLQPAASNRVIVRSAEPVLAGRIDLVLGLGEQPGRQILYRLNVPR